MAPRSSRSSWTLLEHTADVGVLARGADRGGALAAASRGLAAILVDPETVDAREERAIRASGRDEAAQVVAWLGELIYLFDAEGWIARDVVVDAWSAEGIAGRARGEPVDPARHALRTAVKAVTYHQFESRPEPGGGHTIRFFVDL